MNIRKATKDDASRIAEIFIFTKRSAYRGIYNDDYVSFGVMQVLPLALEFQNNEELLENFYVYDDAFVKGLVNLDIDKETGSGEIKELYIEPAFQKEKIGTSLIDFSKETFLKSNIKSIHLWVLEKNIPARSFYEKHGFIKTNEKKLQEGTAEYIMKYTMSL